MLRGEQAHTTRSPRAEADGNRIDPRGRERAKNFTRKVDAERFLVSVETDKLRGEWVDPRLSKVTFADWTERWWGTVSHLKPYTLEGYESLPRVHILPRFGDVSIGRIQPMQVREWVSDRRESGLSASRTRQAYYLFAQILRAAVETGHLARTPCVGVTLPRMQRREMRFLTADEVRRIAKAVDEPYDVLLYVLAYGGLRWGEVCALRRGRCEVLRSRLHVAESMSEIRGGFDFGPTKTYQRRTVVIPAFLRDLLVEHLARHVDGDQDALVFTTNRGEPMRRKTFGVDYWKPAVDAAGVEELRVHDLRHTCAALLIATGANPKAVQAHLGHSSIQVTYDRYGHLFPSDQEALADRMNDVYLASSARRASESADVVGLPAASRGGR